MIIYKSKKHSRAICYSFPLSSNSPPASPTFSTALRLLLLLHPSQLFLTVSEWESLKEEEEVACSTMAKRRRR